MEFRKTTVAGNNVCEASFASPDGYGFGSHLNDGCIVVRTRLKLHSKTKDDAFKVHC